MSAGGQAPTNADPFFIVGCVRSGTTLLRNILRTHPALFAPEETHFFRWGDPYGHKMFRRYYFDIPSDLQEREPIYRLHRRIDGIEDSEFSAMMNECRTRAELQTRYNELFLARRGLEGRRWFDKSPQNIYGVLLLRASFPGAGFIHLVRNPLDIAASMKLGRVIRSESVVAACNYWLEAVQIFGQFREAWPEQSFEVKYERLTKAPAAVLAELGRFLGIDADRIGFDLGAVRERVGRQRALLDAGEIETIKALCGPFMEHYGYALPKAPPRKTIRGSASGAGLVLGKPTSNLTDGADEISSPGHARFVGSLLDRDARVVADGVSGLFARILASHIGSAGHIAVFEPDPYAYWSLVGESLPGTAGIVEVRCNHLGFGPGPEAEDDVPTIPIDEAEPGGPDLLWFGSGEHEVEVVAQWLAKVKKSLPIIAWPCRHAGPAWTFIRRARGLGYGAWLVRLPASLDEDPDPGAATPVMVLVPEERLASALDILINHDATSVETPDILLRILREAAASAAELRLPAHLERMIKDFANDSPLLANEARLLLEACVGAEFVRATADDRPGRQPMSDQEPPSLARDLRLLVEQHGLFDGAFYLDQHAHEIDVGTDPFVHFLDKGWRERFNPSLGFDVGYYLDANPDVAASGMNPLLHYIFHGHAEGRPPIPGGPFPAITPSRPSPVDSSGH